jgi:hypothetical protein
MSSRLHRILAALCCAATLSGCGGGSAIAPLPLPASSPESASPPASPPASPSPTTPPPAPPALTSSTAALALAVSGQPRHFVITNVGGQDALNLVATATTALPAGTSFTTDCATLAPGASCTLTVTPGAIPSATPGDLAPLPAEMGLSGSNTNTLALSIWVLDFGSVYQGGHLFDIDDSTPATAGVGGKVLALNDALPSVPFMPWGPNDSATFLSLSITDGAANTAAVVHQYGPPPSASDAYPAWACDSSNDAGFSDWYLPAICEMGYDDGNGLDSGCGTSSSPTMPNVQLHLVDRGHAAGLPPVSQYWSSSALPATPWVQRYASGDSANYQEIYAAGDRSRCVRALTP